MNGEIALRTGQAKVAALELQAALDIGQRISYPTLIWQAAYLLARAHAEDGKLADALSATEPARASN